MKLKKPGPQKGTKHSEVKRSSFGLRLFNARKTRGITQQELANKLNMTKRMIANYEGLSDGLTIDKISAIAKILDVTASYLLGESTFKKPKDDTPFTVKKAIDKLKELPKKDQKNIVTMIDALELKNKIEKKK